VELANLPGFKLIDFFIVMTKGKLPGKPYAQKRGRKNHSYLMLFRKLRSPMLR